MHTSECEYRDCQICAAELALSAFDNELETITLADKNRQYKALTAAHANACVYTPERNVSTLALQHEIVRLARTMGFTL